MAIQSTLAETIHAQLLLRNEISAQYIPTHCESLARTCEEMARRFRRGGRLLAIGHGPYATDAQHIAVEFVHPIVVGKRALPALDLSSGPPKWLEVMVRPDDVVMGFGPPDGVTSLTELLDRAEVRGASFANGRVALAARHYPLARPIHSYIKN